MWRFSAENWRYSCCVITYQHHNLRLGVYAGADTAAPLDPVHNKGRKKHKFRWLVSLFTFYFCFDF